MPFTPRGPGHFRRLRSIEKILKLSFGWIQTSQQTGRMAGCMPPQKKTVSHVIRLQKDLKQAQEICSICQWFGLGAEVCQIQIQGCSHLSCHQATLSPLNDIIDSRNFFPVLGGSDRDVHPLEVNIDTTGQNRQTSPSPDSGSQRKNQGNLIMNHIMGFSANTSSDPMQNLPHCWIVLDKLLVLFTHKATIIRTPKPPRRNAERKRHLP